MHLHKRATWAPRLARPFSTGQKRAMKCHQIKKNPTEIESWIFSTKFFFPKSSHGSSVDEASENAVKLDTKTQHVAQARGGVTPLESINWT